MVRAKFKVEKIIETTGGKEIILSPVTASNPENSEFFKWTPFGEIRMGTINEKAAEQFRVGEEFYVDFTSAA